MPSSSHQLKAFHVSMISIGGIIGAGLFVGTSATIAASGPAVILSYLVAGGLVWCVMRLLAILTLKTGQKGSFVTYIAHLLGARAAFVTGWSYAFLWAVTAGAQAVAGGFILSQLFGCPPVAGALAFVVIAWSINRLSLRHYGEAEAGLSVMKLTFIGGFIALCLFWLFYNAQPVDLIRRHLFGDGGFFPRGVWAVIGAIPMIMQSFSGCEIAVVAAADSDDPESNIRRIVKRLPLQILFFYAGSVAMIVMVMPWSRVQVGTSPFLSALQTMSMPFASWAAVGVTLIAVLSCLNSSVYVVSRILKEMAGLSLAPRQLAEETERHVPLWALRLTTGLELLIIAFSVGSPTMIYPVLLGASGGVIMFVYFMIAWGCLSLQRNASQCDPGDKGDYLVARLIVALLPVSVVVLLYLPKARIDTLLSGGTVVLLSLLACKLFPARHRAGNADWTDGEGER